ncbi:hypothetical protein Sviol_47910 [Streptomyces violascens]|uniref:Uncharacterized protein n=1 Tax=Streptomyces violascens TaxID=67381 RepID=A0ABQ3QSZ8_9ACTN|nr:hypothetical protein Sviol_47910 [Streptomyces violascens]
MVPHGRPFVCEGVLHLAPNFVLGKPTGLRSGAGQIWHWEVAAADQLLQTPPSAFAWTRISALTLKGPQTRLVSPIALGPI